MSTTAPRQRHDRGFTLIEIVIAIVVVGSLSAVAVVGVSQLTDSGSRAACTASLDAARAAARVHLVSTGTSPTTFDEMVASGALELAHDLTIGDAGTTLAGDGWQLDLTPGSTPTFECVSDAAPPTTVPMFEGPTQPMQLCVETSTGDLLDGATLMIYAGAWYTVGATSGGDCLDAAVPEGTSAVAVRHRGVYQQVAWSAGTASGGTTVFEFATSPHAVRLVDSAGQGIAGAPVEFYALAWQTLGTTGTDGCATTELLTGSISFSVRHRGVYVQETVDTSSGGSSGCGSVPVFSTFRTEPRFVQALTGSGDPAAGVDVSFYAGSWQPFGTTGADGCANTELLPGSIVPGAHVASVYVQVGVDLAVDPSTTCATAVVLQP